MRRRLRRHGAGTVLVAGVLIGLWALSGAHFFWPLIPLMILAFSFARRRMLLRYWTTAGGLGRPAVGSGRSGPGPRSARRLGTVVTAEPPGWPGGWRW